MTNKKRVIFFAAASPKRVPESQTEIYHRIVDHIRKLGYNLSLDWLNVESNNKLSNEETYTTSMSALKSSDLLVAEVSYPSIGLGEQIALAVQRKIPVACLYNETVEKVPSKLLPRTRPNLLQLFPYNNKALENVIENVLSRVMGNDFEKFNFIITPLLNEYLLKESVKRQMSKSEFLRYVIEDWKNAN